MDKPDEEFEEDEEEFEDEEELEEEDEFDDEEDENEETEVTEEVTVEEPVEKVIDKSKARLTTPEEDKKIIPPQEILLPVVIEVGRLKMTVQTLMELTPGNLLELDVHPETGVDLVVNGSRVGRGELLQIGETLGVRVLEIG